MRYTILSMAVRWLTVALILRVLVTIVMNYPDYFPPNFNSLFLEGREATFHGTYRMAFYVHIFTAPIVLVNGLLLLSESVRRRYRGLHRRLGWLQVVVLLFMLPSSVMMSRHAFGGWPAGLSFLLLSLSTGFCVVVGVIHARRHRYQTHRLWMLRSYVLICSAVSLRLISGTASMIGVSSPETAYAIAAWCSWLVPLTTLEISHRLSMR